MAPSLSCRETRKSIARPMAWSTLSAAGLSWAGAGASSVHAACGSARTSATRAVPKIVFIELLLFPRLFRDHAEVGLDHVAVFAAHRVPLSFPHVSCEAPEQRVP